MAVLLVEQELSLDPAGLTSGLVDLAVLEIGGRSVLYALSRSENLLIEIERAGDGTLSIVNQLQLSGTFATGSDPVLSHISLANGTSVLALAGMSEGDGQAVSLGADGTLGAQTPLAGVGTLAASQSLQVSGTPSMISGGTNGGLNLFTGTGVGFSWTATLDDTPERTLGDVTDLMTFTMGAQTFVGTVSVIENGVNLARVTNAGLTQTGALGPAQFLPIGTPEDLEVIQRLGETHLVVASSGSSSLTTIEVGASGVPMLADHILDSDTSAFGGARALATEMNGDVAYVAVGGDEGGVSLLTMLPGGRLVHLDTIADDNVLSLERITSVEMSISGSALQIFASSFWANDITRLTYNIATQGSVFIADTLGTGASGTALDDQVIGSDVGEALSGGAGADILLDGAGIDTLSGGLGEDLFVFSQDGVLDVITDFEVGIDRLDLSAFDFLYDINQLSLAPETDGATLTHADETIRVFTADGAPLTLDALSNDAILNVDRPPYLATAQSLSGGGSADSLSGGQGNDTLLGNGGDDTLFGNGGDDTIDGGAGNDQIDGGAGNDTLRGQSDNDTLIGSIGNDIILGDAGDDLIYGDDWAGG